MVYPLNCYIIFIHQTVDIYNKLFDTGCIPLEWLEDKLILLKKKSYLESYNDFRTISIQTAVFKLFDGVNENRIYPFFENIIHKEQAGFRKGLSAIEQVFFLRTIALEYKYYYKKTFYIVFLDFKKVYDTIDHICLSYKQYINGMNGKLWRLYNFIYDNVISVLSINNILSEEIIKEVCIGQGWYTSTDFFVLMANDVVDVLRNINIGLYVGLMLIFIILFADDISL